MEHVSSFKGVCFMKPRVCVVFVEPFMNSVESLSPAHVRILIVIHIETLSSTVQYFCKTLKLLFLFIINHDNKQSSV